MAKALATNISKCKTGVIRDATILEGTKFEVLQLVVPHLIRVGAAPCVPTAKNVHQNLLNSYLAYLVYLNILLVP